MHNETETSSSSSLLRSTWFTVFVVEPPVISAVNGFTNLTFARNRHLRKRTTYLIINLTVADFFVGTVSGPMHIYHTMTFEPGSGFTSRPLSAFGSSLSFCMASAGTTFFLIAPQVSKHRWASFIIAVLFTVIVSYVMIALNVNRKVPPYSSGAVSSERKLTVTSLLVIVLSSLAFLPCFFLRCPWSKQKIERFIH